MLFLVFLFGLFVFLGLAFWSSKKLENACSSYVWDYYFQGFVLLSIVFAITTVVMLVCIFFTKIDTPARAVKLNEWKSAIEFKIESGLNADDLNLLDKDIVDDIRDYNATIKTMHMYRANPWVSIFYSSAYDELEPIDYQTVTSTSNLE